jgi:hypothetical protein
MWDFYMAWRERAFRERYINVVHLLMTKNTVAEAATFPAQTPSTELTAR